MKRIPLCRRIRRRQHREVAEAQDTAVEVLYSVFPRAVLHGGTAIWRCYSGNRFSEDLDLYLERDPERIGRLFELLEKRGLEVLKRRMGENALYSTLKLGEAEMRLEAVFRKVRGILGEYETCGGDLLTVYTLSPEDLLEEKVEAYLTRRKIRDLYDVFYLLRLVEKSEKNRERISRLLRNFKSPTDERELKVVILFGAVPSVGEMLEYLRRWAG